jgi:RNA polymerase sigma factor (sigma-70 family)
MPSPLRTDPRRVREASDPSVGREDDTLLAHFGASDPEGSSAFVARFQGRVFGLALTILGERRAAEDVAQQALLRAWQHAAVFDPRRGSVGAWLSTITRNLAIDAIRARRLDVIDPDDLARLPLAAAGQDPARVVVGRDDVARLREALARLPDEQRRAVLLARFGGLSAREIALQEGIPLGTAKTRIHTGLGRLRTAFAHDDSD